jgi:hypothetical protein
MKYRKFFLLAFVIAMTCFFYADKHLYFFGKGYLEIYGPLPGGLRPDYWGHDLGNFGFVILDAHQIGVITPGVKYPNLSGVKSVDKYGFNKELLVAIVTDSTGSKTAITCQSFKGSIRVSVDKAVNQKYAASEFDWIYINLDSMRAFQVFRIVSLFFVLIFTMGFAYIIFRRS